MLCHGGLRVGGECGTRKNTSSCCGYKFKITMHWCNAVGTAGGHAVADMRLEGVMVLFSSLKTDCTT